jgi:hypothetical protein
MLIIPYRLQPPQKSTTDFTMTVAWIFTTCGGTAVWETDEATPTEQQVIEDYLHANGFFGTSRGVHDDCLFFEIDPEKTKFSDFWVWSDFLEKGHAPSENIDVWRPFFWIGEVGVGQDDSWGWMNQTKELTLTKFGSLDKFWKIIGRS